MKNKKVVLLLSGGIDSIVLLYYLLDKEYEVYPCHINYGQKTLKGELKAIKEIVSDLNINSVFEIDIHKIGGIGKGSLIGEYPEEIVEKREWLNSEFFPNRNLMLLCIAAMYAYQINADNIGIGLVGKSYKDTSEKFITQFKNIIEYSLKNIDIIAPYIEKDKTCIINDAVKLHVPLEATFSCNALGDRHCMLCTSCIEHFEGIDLYRKLIKNKR